MTDDRPLLHLADVGVTYPTGTVALAEISLRLAPGEFVSVIGPSGCGKSTLLRVASGLAKPTTGTAAANTDSLGYVFQDPTLLPWRSVQHNVELAGELRGLARTERRERAQKAIERVGLADFADERPGTLSGGMRMRTSLARTLSMRPDLMLLDEPFGALDEITRGRLGDDLQGLFLADRFAALLVTHSVAEAVYLSSRVLVMSPRPGRIVAEIKVPLPYPRAPQARFGTDFAALTAQVSTALADASGHVPAEVSS